MRTIIFLLCCLIIKTSFIYGQDIKGVIVNEKNEPIEYASVIAYSLPDTVFITGTQTDSLGKFCFKRIDEKFVLKITRLGYTDKFVNADGSTFIVMKENIVTLKDVTVNGQRHLLKQEKNEISANVAGTLLENEMSLTSLLGKMPGLYVDGDVLKTFSAGRIIYYINNKEVLSNVELKVLDIKNINSIKIRHTPGAQHSADASVIINIITKKQKGGFSMRFESYERMNQRFTHENNLTVNLNNDTYSIFGTLGFAEYRSIYTQSFDIKQNDLDNPWSFYSDMNGKHNTSEQITGALGVDLFPNSKNLFSLRYYHSNADTKNRSTSATVTRYDCNTTLIDGNTKNTADKKSHNITAYYRTGIARNFIFEATADYMRRDFYRDEKTYEHSETTTRNYLSNASDKYEIAGFMSKITWSITGNWQFVAGGGTNYSKLKSTNDVNIHDISNTDNHLNENGTYAYAEINKTWGFGLQGTVGIRYEHMKSKFTDNVSRTIFSRTYNDWFPTFSLSYTHNGMNHSLSFKSSISRPAFSDLTGNEAYMNRYMYQTNNPELISEKAYKLTYSLFYKFLNWSASYSKISNPIIETAIIEQYEDIKRIKMSKENFNKSNRFETFLSFFPRFGIYNPTLTTGFIYNNLSASKQNKNSTGYPSKPFFIIRWNNTFTFPKDFQVQAEFNFNAKGNNGYIVYNASSRANLSIQKYFLNKKLQINIKFNDIYNGTKTRYKGSIYNLHLKGCDYRYNRNIIISLKLYLNKFKNAHNISSSITSEKERM